MKADLVYPLRAGTYNTQFPELRYSLRSAPDGHQVWVLGGKPKWLVNANHVPVAQPGGKYQNVRKIMRWACNSPLISDPFLWLNDDMFWLTPTTPMLHGGPFAGYVSRLAGNAYSRGGRETLRILHSQGYADPLSWSLHTPILVHKQPMLVALDLAADSRLAIHVRTLYGALSALEGVQHRDVKVHASGLPDPEWPYVSTSDEAFQRREVGQWIRNRWQVPSSYEA